MQKKQAKQVKEGQTLMLGNGRDELAEDVSVIVNDWQNGAIYVQRESGACEWVNTDKLYF